MKQRSNGRDTFIESLNLPSGVEAIKFKGMNRVHFKYRGVGFCVIDMKVEAYNLASRKEYMDAIGCKGYEITYSLGPNKAVVKDIPYNNSELLYMILGYIVKEV